MAFMSQQFYTPVAPYVGAWIETEPKAPATVFDASHPTWVRGLKLIAIVFQKFGTMSHPTCVRGLKQQL